MSGGIMRVLGGSAGIYMRLLQIDLHRFSEYLYLTGTPRRWSRWGDKASAVISARESIGAAGN